METLRELAVDAFIVLAVWFTVDIVGGATAAINKGLSCGQTAQVSTAKPQK